MLRRLQGISQWSERRHDARDARETTTTRESSWNKKATFSPSDPTSNAVGSGYTGRPDRVQVLPTGPDHTFKATMTSTPATTPTNGGSRLYKTTSVHRVGSPYRGGGSPGSPFRDSPTYRDSPYRDSPYRDSPYRDDSDELPVSIHPPTFLHDGDLQRSPAVAVFM